MSCSAQVRGGERARFWPRCSGGFGPTLADRVASDLLDLVPEGPAIQHLFESSSSPMENQYFAQRIRRSSVGAIRYWESTPGKDEVNLVRSHSYTALVAEDLFRLRLAAFLEGRMRFDHPPIPIFDEKLAMYLPFSPPLHRGSPTTCAISSLTRR